MTVVRGPEPHRVRVLFLREDRLRLHLKRVADAFDVAVRRSDQQTIRFHDLRRKSATLARRAGVSPEIVRERLGRAKVGLTPDTYAHAVPGWQGEAAQTVPGFVIGGRS